MDAALLGAAGVLLFALGAAGRRGVLPRNRWFGLRSRTTLRGDAEWRAAHVAGGPLLCLAGLAWVAAAVARWRERGDLERAAFLGGFVLVVVAGLIGNRAAARRR